MYLLTLRRYTNAVIIIYYLLLLLRHSWREQAHA